MTATLLDSAHPILAGITLPVPPILGLNKLHFRGDESSTLLATCPYRCKDWPLLAVRTYGAGRTAIWSTDIGPDWLSLDFLGWHHYGTLMAILVNWIGHKDITL